MRSKFLLAFSFIFAVACGAADKLQFNRDIRPILSDKCFSCHGPDEHGRKGGLRLDIRADALKDHKGVRAIVPGDTAASEVVSRILTDDPDDKMPPPEGEKHLSAAEAALLKRWIAEGAEYQQHWAYATPERPAVPAVEAAAWQGNPIDRFVMATLKKQQLQPVPPADPVTLVRRLYVDLTGLPPTPEVIDAFAADPSDAAWGSLVEDLLKSPHYGERMASYWLDLVRFADTQGYHSDDQQNIYPYRDYIIKAFNSNKPFSEFTIEQLAGDLLPEGTQEQKIASGYNRLNQVTGEGGAQPGEYLSKYMSDRIRTTTEVWLGSTLGCAECHDHKYDPFSQKDFYRFGAFFADLEEVGVYSGNARSTGNYPPMLDIVPADRQAQLTELAQQLEKLRAEEDRLIALQARTLKPPTTTTAWQVLTPTAADSSGDSTLEIRDDASVLATGGQSKNENYTVSVTVPGGTLGALNLEILPDASFKGFSRGADNVVITGVELHAVTGVGGETRRRLVPVAVEASETRSKNWPAEGILDDNPKTGWAAYADKDKQTPRTVIFRFAKTENLGSDATLEVVIRHEAERDYHNTGCFRLSAAATTAAKLGGEPTDQALVKAIETVPEKRTDADNTRLRTYILTMPSKELGKVESQIAAIAAEQEKLTKGTVKTMVSKPVKPRVVRVLPRGDWLNDNGEIVEPGVPHFLPQAGTGNERQTRLDLANWLLSADNPLTGRVFANRLWYLFFGQGISNVLNDLGSQGEWPVHPELLDWMAVEFRESGWDMQHMVRLLVTSRAYRLGSIPTEPQLAADPLNRYHARQARFRLQAEFVRDNALAISGLLVEDIGGASVRPYQPAGYWADSYKSVGKPHIYNQDHGTDLYRRGMYTFWKRTFLHPSLMAFDAPGREACEARRSISNTPLQALVLLNDPSYVEAARAFAARAIREGGGTSEARVRWIMRQAVGRAPTAAEQAVLLDLLRQKQARYGNAPDDAKALVSAGEAPVDDKLPAGELAAWTAVTRTVLNLHETITRN